MTDKEEISKLLDDNYDVICRRGLITENTTKTDFINKFNEEFVEIVASNSNINEYTDLLMCLCNSQYKYNKEDVIKAFSIRLDYLVSINEIACSLHDIKCRNRDGVDFSTRIFWLISAISFYIKDYKSLMKQNIENNLKRIV